MQETNIHGKQIRDGTVTRQDLNTSIIGSQVITRVLQDANGIITFTSTGVDAGTGDVTIKHVDSQGYKHIPTGGNVGELLVNSASGTAVWSAYSSLSYWTKSGNDIYYNSGNVGIGMTSPTGTLHVNGTFKVNTGVGGDYTLSGYTLSAPSSFIVSSSGYLNLNSGSMYTAFANNTGEKMRLDYSGNLGIGTTVPIAKLDVRGDVLVLTDANSTGLFAKNTAGTQLFSATRQGTDLSLSSYNGIGFAVTKTSPSSAYSMYINGTGNVGIGTTAPGAKLEVAGITKISGDSSYLSIERSSDAYVTQLNINSGVTPISAFRIVTDKTNNLVALNARNNQAFTLQTNDAERIRITSAGNVGVGTSSPGDRLEVNGDIGVMNSSKLNFGSQLTNPSYIKAIWNDNTRTGLEFHTFVYGVDTISLTLDKENSNTIVAKNLIVQGAGNSSFSGNVGIGTTAPGNALHIDAGTTEGSLEYALRLVNQGTTANTATGLVFQDNSYSAGTYGKGAIAYVRGSSGYGRGDVVFLNDAAADTNEVAIGDEVMRITNAGNVGIGTTSPAKKLQVSDTSGELIRVTDPNSNGAYIGFTNAATSFGNIGAANHLITGGVNTDFAIQTSGNLNIATGGITSRMFIKSNGNVGIGTTNPGARLNIVENGPASDWDSLKVDFQANGTANGYYTSAGRFINTLATSSHSYGVGVLGEAIKTGSYGYTGTGAEGRGIYRSNSLGIDLNYLNFFGVSGKISIEGTGANTINSGKSIYAYANIDAGNTLTTYTGVYVASPTGTGTITNKYALIIEAGAGNVGIGVTNPAQKLTVSGDLLTTGKQYVGATSVYLDYSGGDLALAAGSATKMIIQSGGNVGIGTTNPLQKLHVAAGDINLDTNYGIRVNNTATAGQYLRGNGTRFVPSTISASDVPLNDKGGWVYNYSDDLLYSSRQNIVSHVSVGIPSLLRYSAFQVYHPSAPYAEMLVFTDDNSVEKDFNVISVNQGNGMLSGWKGVSLHSYDLLSTSFIDPNAVLAGFKGDEVTGLFDFSFGNLFAQSASVEYHGLKIKYVYDSNLAAWTSFGSLFGDTIGSAAFELWNHQYQSIPAMRIWHGSSNDYLQFTHNSSHSVIESNQTIGVIGVGGISFYTGGIITYVKNAGLGIDVANPAALLHLGAGGNVKAPLKFTSGTNLTTPQSGAMEWDGTRLYITNSARQTLAYLKDFGLKSSQTAVINAASNSLYTDLIGTDVGTNQIPANTYQVGDQLIVDVAGVFTTVANIQGITIKVVLNSTNVVSLPAYLPGGVSPDPWNWTAKLTFTIKTTGASGKALLTGMILAENRLQGYAHVQPLTVTSEIDIDTTAANTLKLQAQWTNLGNSLKSITSSTKLERVN